MSPLSESLPVAAMKTSALAISASIIADVVDPSLRITLRRPEFIRLRGNEDTAPKFFSIMVTW